MATSDTTQRITLPNDLARSLTYLDDAQLRRLCDAANAETERRLRLANNAHDRVSSPADETARIPEGKVNLVQASFKAGLKPAAIARSSGIPLALVRHILKANDRRTDG